MNDYLVVLEYEAAQLPEQELVDLRRSEAERSHELQSQGIIIGLWRLPGRRASCSLWRVRDADALHEALVSLPYWPWMSATVTALAQHPNWGGGPDAAPGC
ncbi:MAG: muconolactone Delta-isomerase family protein [Actinomycetota bacterium]|nr:muconolactone Delta-isomerase family protein [Actinomycetota bacterium]